MKPTPVTPRPAGKEPIPRLRIRVTLPTLTLAIFAILTASSTLAPSTAAASSTAWQINQEAMPTYLSPSVGSGISEQGTHFALSIVDVGGAEAAAGVTITDHLSVGATPVAQPDGYRNPTAKLPAHERQGARSYPCVISGQTVTCEVKTAVPPGERVHLSIPLELSASPPSSVTNEVTVSSPGVAPVTESLTVLTSEEALPFGFVDSSAGLSGSAFDESGVTPAAGAHPFDVTMAVNEPSVHRERLEPVEPLRGLDLELPAGLVADPLAVKERCTQAEMLEAVAETPIQACPAASQVGVVRYSIVGSLEGLVSPLFDMVPPPGAPAEFAFDVQGNIVHIRGGLAGSFHLTAASEEITAKFPIPGVHVELWGDPSDPRHDHERQGEGMEARCAALDGCSVAPAAVPFLTMPTSCGEPLTLGAGITGWLGGEAHRSTSFTDLEGNPVTLSGCGQLAFEPTIDAQATTEAGESPSGLDFSLHQPQDETLEGHATAALKDATVTLPEGMVLNPSAANGLASCTEEQIGYAPEEGKIRFKTTPQTCPNAAKIGTIEVKTPLLEKTEPGSIYVAKPYGNPFGSLLAIYLAVEDEETGIIAKLAGHVTPDPVTGRLTATFTENPELPLEDINLHFFKDGTGVLTTPLTCGQSATTATLTPWSTPEGADAHLTSAFPINTGCYPSEAAAPKTASFSAGTVQPLSGAYSPFVFRISRPDGSQHLTGIETTLPEGVLASVAGVSYCPESGIAQAQAREEPEKGKLEQTDPSCPASSELGTVNVTAGSGAHPIPVSGHAYLAGPYKGAPLSLVVIVPGVAGPFDLGTVVDRAALFINEQTARVRAVADPLPTIRDGIPLDVRSIEVDLNRPGFTLNPTSCDAMAVEGQIGTEAGQSVSVSNRFQVGGCQELPFKPALTAKTGAKGSRSNGASLTVKVAQKTGEAGIHKVELQLPRALPSRDSTLKQACTEAQFAANPANCPPGAFIGTATATTPILKAPLTGPAILVSHGGAAFPDVEFLLQANERGAPIKITLDGKTDIEHNITYSRFETVPDAPITSFETKLTEGPHSILGVYLPESAKDSFCGQDLQIPTVITGQNGKVVSQDTSVGVEGCPKTITVRHTVAGRTVTLTVYAPAAGKITAGGKGLTGSTRKAKGPENITIKLKQKKSGRLKTTIKVTFKPTKGKAQTKRTTLRLKA